MTTASLARDVLLWSGPRSARRAALYLAAAAMVVLVAAPGAFKADHPVTIDGHAMSSMNMAIAWAYCGRPYHISSKFDVPGAMVKDDTLRALPVRDAIARVSGSLEAHCASLHGLANNENSLMLTETAIMKAAPGASMAEVGWVLHGLRVAAILGFAFMLLALGGSVAMTAGVIVVMLDLLDAIRAFFYSNYPFLAVMVVASAAGYAAALRWRWGSTPRRAVALGLGVGLLSAYAANIRTSYLPILVAHFGLFLAAEAWMSRAAARAWLRPLVMAAGFAAAFIAFQTVMISRFFPEAQQQAQRHSIAHPLVLALSAPPNDLSRELGITWLDSVGAEKALSVDPEAGFLGPKYDAALFAYYKQLWMTRPWDMLGVYWLKFGVVGPDMIGDLRLRNWLIDLDYFQLLAPMAWLPDGHWIFALYALLTLAALAAFARRPGPVSFGVVLLGTATVLLEVEAGLIYSEWVPQYHAYLAFSCLFVSLAGLQAAANGVTALALRARDSARLRFIWIEGERFLGRRPTDAASNGLPAAASAMVQAVIVAVLLWAVVPSAWFTIERTPTFDRGAAASVESAARLVMCGSASAGANAPRPVEEAVLNPDLSLVPLRDHAVERAGSLEAYCAGSGLAASRSLPTTLMEAAALAARPRMSVAGLGRFLHLGRVAVVFVVAVAMLWLGSRPVLVWAAVFAQLWLLVAWRHYVFSGVSFAAVLALPTVLAYAWAARSRGWTPVGAAWAGAWCGLSTSIAPVLAPVQWLCLAMTLATASPRLDARKGLMMALTFVGVSVALTALLGVPWGQAWLPGLELP